MDTTVIDGVKAVYIIPCLRCIHWTQEAEENNGKCDLYSEAAGVPVYTADNWWCAGGEEE